MFFSCRQSPKNEKWQHIEMRPLDDTLVITVITKENKRYFINGIHKDLPTENYLLLDISKIDKLGDAISICWRDKQYIWTITNSYARVVENKLDTTKYNYFEPKGHPTTSGFLEKNCGGILIRENRYPRGNLKVDYVN